MMYINKFRASDCLPVRTGFDFQQEEEVLRDRVETELYLISSFNTGARKSNVVDTGL
jgi:hypothetical protein